MTPRTEVIPVVPQEAPLFDPMPPDAARSTPGRRAHRRGPTLAHQLVSAAALGVLISAAFLAGQYTTHRGVAPLAPLPVADIGTAAATARVWALGTPGERAQHCEWLAALGETRDYSVRAWAAHLRSPAGGSLQDVDPAVVARVLDNACAGRG